MFYTMKTIFFLVAMSLMLVGATIAVAIPNQAEAAWCGAVAPCTNGKGQCEKIPGNEPGCVHIKAKPGI